MTSTPSLDTVGLDVVTIAVEPPRQAEILDLLQLGADFALSLYPAENTFLLNVEELERPGVAVYVARTEGGHAVGMAALVPWGQSVTELKRMFVHPAARGARVAARLLDRMEADARAAGLRQIVLETGTLHTAAQALYARCGYEPIPQFGQYIGEQYSYCMARMLRH